MPDVRKWHRNAEYRYQRHLERQRVIQERTEALEASAVQLWDAMMAALVTLADQCGTTVKEVQDGIHDGVVGYVVFMGGMEHTIHGERVNSQHTRSVTLYRLPGQGGRYWGFEICDDELEQDDNPFWSMFHVLWNRDYREFSLSVFQRTHCTVRHENRDGGTYQINDGMSYQGVSTRLFDDLLQLLGKLATMRVYERPTI